jgi:hypothetical protein
MRTKIIAIFTVAATLTCSTLTFADGTQVDETMKRAKTWLSQQNLTLTYGAGGARNDLSMVTQNAVLVYGEGYGNPDHKNPAQRAGMAKVAATVVAQKALADYLEGFALVGNTVVRDRVTESQVINTAVSAFIQGAEPVYEDYDKDQDKAVVILKIGLHGPMSFGALMYDRLMNDPKSRKSLESGKPEFNAKPAPLEINYDGLIVDATEQSFQPALINRIFTEKGSILYDPAKMKQQFLIEQGCGDYASSVDRAKSALAVKGVKNPLVVKASGSLSRADLQISEDDALTVFSANQQNGFLTGAKVAFVVR